MTAIAPQTENRLATGNGQQPAPPVKPWPTVQDTSPFAVLLDSQKFEHLQRLSALFASSDMVPEQFRGKAANVFIVLQMAFRCGVDPYMMLQNCYVVHGRPGVESKLAIALLNASGQIKGRVSFELTGDGKSRRCIASAIDKATGQVVQQTVSMDMAEKEGWTKKNGSKWLTLPDLMLQYRAAMFLIRLHYPEVLMGMSTKEELDEQEFLGPAPRQRVRGKVDLEQLTSGMDQPAQIEAAAPAPATDPEPVDSGERMPVTEVADLMAGCTKAGFGGLELVGFLKANFGPNKLSCDDLTPEEGARLRRMLDSMIDGDKPAPKGQSA